MPASLSPRMHPAARVYVSGHTGLVGAALMRRLQAAGYHQLITCNREQLDLRIQGAVDTFFAATRPDFVIHAAAKVGGILANSTQPADFIRENLQIQLNVIEAARQYGVQRLLFLGSSCIYPRLAPQPMREAHLMTGPLEPTNAAYAVAKLAGIQLCEAYNAQYGTHYLPVLPTNLYGPGDNFDLATSHVLPAMIRRFHEAKERGAAQVTLWGTGSPRREFLYVDDLADAVFFLLTETDAVDLINIGVGEDLSIAEVANLVAEVVGYRGELRWDASKPDGTQRKLLDVSRMSALGWRAKTGLREGVGKAYADYLSGIEDAPNFL